MKLKSKLPIILMLVFLFCFGTIVTVTSPSVEAVVSMKDAQDLCYMLNTDISSGKVDWNGAMKCVYDITMNGS